MEIVLVHLGAPQFVSRNDTSGFYRMFIGIILSPSKEDFANSNHS